MQESRPLSKTTREEHKIKVDGNMKKKGRSIIVVEASVLVVLLHVLPFLLFSPSTPHIE